MAAPATPALDKLGVGAKARAVAEGKTRLLLLSGTKLGDDGVREVAACIASSGAAGLEELNLASCDIGADVASALADSLRDRALRRVNLNGNGNLGDAGGAAVAAALASCKSLKAVSLNGCGLADEAGTAFAELLQSSTSLEELSINDNALTEDGCGAKLSAALAATSAPVRAVDVSKNKLRKTQGAIKAHFESQNSAAGAGAGAAAAAGGGGGDGSALKAASMKVWAMAEKVRSGSTARMWALNSKLTDDVCADLAAACAAHPGFTDLNLGKNEIGDAGAAVLAEMIGNHPGIKNVKLNGNKIGAAGCRALAAAATKSKSLVLINLAQNPVGDDGVTAFALALPKCTTLGDLSFNSCENVTAAGADKLLEALPNNSSLRQLNLAGIAADGVADKAAACLAILKERK